MPRLLSQPSDRQRLPGQIRKEKNSVCEMRWQRASRLCLFVPLSMAIDRRSRPPGTSGSRFPIESRSFRVSPIQPPFHSPKLPHYRGIPQIVMLLQRISSEAGCLAHHAEQSHKRALREGANVGPEHCRLFEPDQEGSVRGSKPTIRDLNHCAGRSDGKLVMAL